jgi:hypothetical protein
MKYSKILRSLAILSAVLIYLSSPAQAAFSPLAVSLFAPIQFPPTDFSVTGLRLNLLYSHHRDMYGFDFGLGGNSTDQQFTGIGVAGVFNWNRGATTAVFLQAAGIANVNVNKATIVGFQIAGMVNSNKAESSVIGIQLAPVNLAQNTKIYGLQTGLYNQAQDVYGFQIGILNFARSLHGLQIGLLNFNQTGLFSVAPILNVGF